MKPKIRVVRFHMEDEVELEVHEEVVGCYMGGEYVYLMVQRFSE